MTGTITALVLQKNNKERVSVFLDEQYAFSLSLLRAAQLKRGQYLSEEQIKALRSQDERDKAYNRALNYLSYRPRSQAEMERYLLGKGWDEVVVCDVIDRLQQIGLVDDREFAHFWVDNRQRFRPRGRMALRYEMKTRGLGEEIIAEVLEDVDEEQSAYELASSRARKETGLAPREFRRKLGQYLARRGFSFSVIEAVLRKIEQEMEQPHDEETTDLS